MPHKVDRWRTSFILSSAIHLLLLSLLWTHTAPQGGTPGQPGKPRHPGPPQTFEEAMAWGEEDRLEAERLEAEKKARGSDEGGILARKQEGSERDEPMQVSIHFLPPKEEEKVDGLTECEGDNWFGGIGIHHDPVTKEITKVVEGYPAAKAGLMVGDVFRMDVESIRGLPGSPVRVTVSRFGEILVFDLIRDRICVEGKKPK